MRSIFAASSAAKCSAFRRTACAAPSDVLHAGTHLRPGRRGDRRAYRIAVESTAETHPPLRPAYEPADQMMVIALGRLGMREFDLASDADLLFVIPDEDADEHAFWTRVAERLIDMLTAYTGEGVLFAVDTRLRPNGSAGALVQTEQRYQGVFREERRGVGRHRLHEIAHRGGRHRARARVSCKSSSRWTGGGTARAAVRAIDCGRCARASRRSRDPRIR